MSSPNNQPLEEEWEEPLEDDMEIEEEQGTYADPEWEDDDPYEGSDYDLGWEMLPP